MAELKGESKLTMQPSMLTSLHTQNHILQHKPSPLLLMLHTLNYTSLLIRPNIPPKHMSSSKKHIKEWLSVSRHNSIVVIPADDVHPKKHKDMLEVHHLELKVA